MAHIEEAIRARLIASTGITGLVGSTSNSRVFFLRLPDATNVPALVYQRISREGFPTYAEARDMARRRIQIDCWAASGQVAANLANAVRKQMDGFSGTQSTVPVRATFLVDEANLYDDELDLYRVRQDYSIVHFESTS